MSGRNNRRGNMLAIVVAILFILVVLVLGLHTSQSKAARNVTQAEAELQFRQGFEFEVARMLAPGANLDIPDWVKVTGATDVLGEKDLGEEYSQTLFKGLPNLDPLQQPTVDTPPGFDTVKVKPTTTDAALKVFAGKAQWLVSQSSGGYAAYAPKGRITLESAAGWGNPTLDDQTLSSQAYSAIPVLLASRDDLKVDDLVYGMAYSSEGELELGGSGGIGFKGKPPLREYESKLASSLDSLKSDMAGAAASGDKTSDIKGGALQTAGSMVEMMFGGDGRPSLTLEQSMKLPFPVIPGFSATVPGVLFEFWFHMPYPPDFASFTSPSGRDATQDAAESKRIDDAIKACKERIKELDAKIAATPAGNARDALIAVRDMEKNKLRDLEDEARDLRNQLEASAAANEAEVGRNVGSSPPNEPITRAEDENIPKEGITGWAYAAVFKNFFSLLKNTLTGNFKEISESLVNEVRIVHFGPLDYEPEFRFDDGFFAKATINVPPGRSFRFQGNCEFEGDLWLQKGSLMHIGGNLRLTDPNLGADGPLAVTGKLVLEEGATLVVDGDITLAGSAEYGSLWVCSEAGKLHPISTAILADGAITIPYGSYTTTSLEDSANWLSSKGGGAAGMGSTLGTFFNDGAPNMSKVAGPFHTRMPFFASYAATFQWTNVPIPVPPFMVPVVTPIPVPRKNMLVPVFRSFTYLYTPALNASLGENLYTHADWWGFGDGTVAVMMKIDPLKMVNGLTSVNLGSLNLNIDWGNQLQTMVEDIIKQAMEFAVKQVAQKLVTEIAKSAVGPVSLILDTLVDGVMGAVTSKEDFLANIQKTLIDGTVGPFIGELERWAGNIEDQIKDGLAEGYLREVNGPLIYANTISIGEAGDSKLAAGMLVAKTNITVEAERFVGSMTCFDGDITARKVLFAPQFTKVSLYKPKATDSDTLSRTAEVKYGPKFDSGVAVGISTGVNMIRTEGWDR